MNEVSRPVTPVFVVGALRSGTTMLRLMLDHHPDICIPGELEFAVPLVSDEGRLPTLEKYVEFLQTHRVFEAWSVSIDPDLDFLSLVRSFLEQKRIQSGKPIAGATVHHHFDRLRYIWPRCRYIHIVRDGRDVARSCLRKGWGGEHVDCGRPLGGNRASLGPLPPGAESR